MFSHSPKTMILSIFIFAHLVFSSPIVRRQALAAGCESVTQTLITGIQSNIAIQYEELSITTQMITTISSMSSNMNMNMNNNNNNINNGNNNNGNNNNNGYSQAVITNTFSVQRSQLIVAVQSSIATRQNNQNIQINNGPPELQQNMNDLANTQSIELNEVQQLGVGPNNGQPQIMSSLNSLAMSFQSSIDLNSRTLQAVLASCPGNINGQTINNPPSPINGQNNSPSPSNNNGQNNKNPPPSNNGQNNKNPPPFSNGQSNNNAIPLPTEGQKANGENTNTEKKESKPAPPPATPSAAEKVKF